jgi:hypothetical protein
VAPAHEQRLHLTSAGEVMGPYVAAGTAFTVELVQPLASDPSLAGTHVLLELRENLDASDGTNVVARGAFIHATIVAAGRAPDAFLKIDLTTVRTMQGDVPIAARLAGAPPAPDSTAYDFVLESAPGEPVFLPRGARLDLVLTEPIVPAGSSYR